MNKIFRMFAEELLGKKTWIMKDKLLYVSTLYSTERSAEKCWNCTYWDTNMTKVIRILGETN